MWISAKIFWSIFGCAAPSIFVRFFCGTRRKIFGSRAKPAQCYSTHQEMGAPKGTFVFRLRRLLPCRRTTSLSAHLKKQSNHRKFVESENHPKQQIFNRNSK